MEETYQLPTGLLLIGVAIALGLLALSLVRAFMRSRIRRHDTSVLDKGLLYGALGLGAWVLVSILWVLIADAAALIVPVKIMGMTLIFFGVGIALAFVLAFVVGRVAGAIRR